MWTDLPHKKWVETLFQDNELAGFDQMFHSGPKKPIPNEDFTNTVMLQ